MIELTTNQKAKIAVDKINRALYRMNAARGMDGANFERLKYDADDFAAVSAAVHSIAKAAGDLVSIINEIKEKAAEIEAARSKRQGGKKLRGDTTARWLQTRTNSRFAND